MTKELINLHAARNAVQLARESVLAALDTAAKTPFSIWLPASERDFQTVLDQLDTAIEYSALKSDEEVWARVPCIQGYGSNPRVVFGKVYHEGAQWALVGRTWESSQPAKYAVVLRESGSQVVLDSKETVKRLTAFVVALEDAESLEDASALLRAWRRGER